MQFFTTKVWILIYLILPIFGYADTEGEFAQAVAHTIRFVDQQQNVIWPGFRISSMPSLLHFSNQHIYAYNFIPTKLDWEKRTLDGDPVYYLAQDELGIANVEISFNFTLENQLAYVYGFLDNYDHLGNLFRFAHERFHAYQFAAFPASTFPLASYESFNNVENVQLAYLEAAAMKEYVLTHDEAAIKDFVAINRYRSRLLDNESKLYEQQKIDTEGTATYVGLKSIDLKQKTLDQFLVHYYENWCAVDSIDAINDCVLRRQYYFVGTGIGMALDQFTQQPWKQDLEKQGICPLTEIIQHYPMTETTIEQRVQHAKIHYHFDTMAKALAITMARYQDEIKQQEKNYQAYPGSEIHYRFSCVMGGLITPQHQYFINGQLSLQLGVDMQQACDNNSIALTFRQLPFLYQSNQESKFKASPDTRLTIDGHHETVASFLAHGGETEFHSLILENDNVTIAVTNRLGILSVKDNSLILQSH